MVLLLPVAFVAWIVARVRISPHLAHPTRKALNHDHARCGARSVTMGNTFLAVTPYMVMNLLLLKAVFFVPGIATWLPGWMA